MTFNCPRSPHISPRSYHDLTTIKDVISSKHPSKPSKPTKSVFRRLHNFFQKKCTPRFRQNTTNRISPPADRDKEAARFHLHTESANVARKFYPCHRNESWLSMTKRLCAALWHPCSNIAGTKSPLSKAQRRH